MKLKDIPIIYVMESTGVAGGHRVIFEHINGLVERGYDVHLWALQDGSSWFPKLKVQVQTFPHYQALEKHLTNIEAVKVATWWKTAQHVNRAVKRGKGWGAYLVQDVETSYYKHGVAEQVKDEAILSTYNYGLQIITEDPWVTTELKRINPNEAYIKINDVGIGIDQEVYTGNKALVNNKNVLMCARSNPLKQYKYGEKAFELALRIDPQLELHLYGVEPMQFPSYAKVHGALSDEGVAKLYQNSRVFVSTSIHEGYNLTIVEAMGCGCPVITTLADGNNHFSINEQNCLVAPHKDPRTLAEIIVRLANDDKIAEQIRLGGFKTAKEHKWNLAIDKLEQCYKKLVGETP